MKCARIMSIAAAAAALLLLPLSGSLRAGAEDDARQYWSKQYTAAVRDLSTGSPLERYRAAMLLGAHRRSEFVRPLSTELLNDLADPARRRTPINDPFVKGAIAWAIGEIGHPIGVAPLIKALEITRQIVKEENERVRQLQTASRQAAEQLNQSSPDAYVFAPVHPSPDRPGPFNQPGHSFGYSPDMFYSVSDEFKAMTPNLNDEGHRIRLESHNYMNLTRQLLISLGRIGSEECIDALKPFLRDEIPMVRYFTALAMGQTASPKALAEINARFTEEQDPYVKVGLSFGGLSIDNGQTVLHRELLQIIRTDDTYVRYHAAVALRDISMGESLQALRAARVIEAEPQIQGILDQAIINAEIDNIVPVNY